MVMVEPDVSCTREPVVVRMLMERHVHQLHLHLRQALRRAPRQHRNVRIRSIHVELESPVMEQMCV